MPANLLHDIWKDIRPFIRIIAGDLLIACALWGSLVIFRYVVRLVPVDGWPGEFIDDLHAGGVVVVFGILACLLVVDILRLKRGS